MKNRTLIIASLLAYATSALAQTTILLTGEKRKTDTRVMVKNYQVVQTDGKTVVSLDFVLDSLAVPSNRFRAFTPVIISRDSTRIDRLKTLIVTGRVQEIVFERDGMDPVYADNYVKVSRQKGEPPSSSASARVKSVTAPFDAQ